MAKTARKKVSAEDFLIERPFGNDGIDLYDQWFDAMRVIIDTGSERMLGEVDLEKVNSKFPSLSRHSSRHDKHLFLGKTPLFESSRKIHGASKSHTRATRLLEYQLRISNPSGLLGRSDDYVTLPSPLWFLRQILTSDDYLASEGYAHSIIRAEIFSSAVRSFPPPDEENIYEYIKKAVCHVTIADSISTIESYVRKRDTSYIRNANITDFILYNYLASMGLASLSLASHEVTNPPARRTDRVRMSVSQFLNQRSIDISSEYGYELLLTGGLSDLPAIPQILNELEGIPLPIPGAKTLFSGGIRTTEKGGAVVRISGTSGSGKTSLALAACTALAPLGIKTIYLSCEEEPDDLRDRIASVTPSFIRETRNYYVPSEKLTADSWFFSDHLNHGDATDNFEESKVVVNEIIQVLKDEGLPDQGVMTRPLGLVPFVIVLDGVHELINRSDTEGVSFERLNELIDHFRKLNVLIILLSSADKTGALKSLDYLVDVVLELDRREHGDISHRPLHIANLTKTRRQFSNTGSHHFHISKRTGVRFYPNLEASLEPYKARKWQKPDESCCFEFGNIGRDLLNPNGNPLKIYWKSHTLVTGKGSSGKAGFALKLLSSPVRVLTETKNSVRRLSTVGNVRRCLIVSFLYPADYYDDLVGRIEFPKNLKESNLFGFDHFEYSVLTLSPGHLSPEVLMTKIVGHIRASELQGIPFDSVLVDGLHNVFLQFPELENNPLIWPMMSELFRRNGLNVVTTHAHFDVAGMDEPSHLAYDVNAITNRSAPLVQTLVNSADYYFDVSAESAISRDWKKYRVRLVTAYGQAVPQQAELYWDREELLLKSGL